MASATPEPGESLVMLEDQPLTPALAASWQRCIRHGLRRQDQALFGDSLSRSRARRVADENAELIAQATPEMQRLYSSLGSSRWLALCVNSGGEVVQATGDRTSAPRELRVLMHPGRLLVEAELGTTAPGCVLEDRRPFVVNRGEHFLHELQHFFCASAPILRPDGTLAGAMDISGVDVEVLPLANDMVGLAVRGIENRMLEAMAECVLLRFHCDERLLGTPFEGILAIDRAGLIAGANSAANRLLALGDNFGVGTPLDAIFDHGLDGLLRRFNAQRGPHIRLRTHLGSVTYLSAERPRTRRPPGTPPIGCLPSPTAPGRASGEVFVLLDERLQTELTKTVRLLAHGLPILIEGETGTGKEVFARTLHRAVRPDGPFVAVNCAAIPEGLIEAELFGYANGAFTGARRGGAAGKIEHAHQGVLFLDEVGDMPLPMQSRLLRVLQERAVVRVGESRELSVDILLICATNRRLTDLVASGRFRDDLYFRLTGHTLRLPPLRERADVAAIIEAMLRRRCAALNLANAAAPIEELITPAALDCLQSFAWPGNIRQVEHVVLALVALLNAERPIGIADLPAEIATAPTAAAGPGPQAQVTTTSLSATESAAIRAALQQQRGNVSAAARALGIGRSTLYVKIRRYRLT